MANPQATSSPPNFEKALKLASKPKLRKSR